MPAGLVMCQVGISRPDPGRTVASIRGTETTEKREGQGQRQVQVQVQVQRQGQRCDYLTHVACSVGQRSASHADAVPEM